MKKFKIGLLQFLSVGTVESSTRLFAFLIIASSVLCILAVVTVFIILMFKGSDYLSEAVNMTIALGGIALGALAGKVLNKESKSIIKIDDSQLTK